MTPLQATIEAEHLGAYVCRQLNTFFPDHHTVREGDLRASLEMALGRVAHCFGEIRLKYFFEDGAARFNHLNSDHYAMFLYLLANQSHQDGAPVAVSEKLFLLNKALHGLDAFYSVTLPPVFLFVHPVGTVLGNAKYGNHFVVYQNCSVGADEDGIYPVLGNGVIMYSRSAIIGRCRIGSNVVLGAGSFVLNDDIAGDTVVVGQSPNLRHLPNRRPVLQRKFTPTAAP